MTHVEQLLNMAFWQWLLQLEAGYLVVYSESLRVITVVSQGCWQGCTGKMLEHFRSVKYRTLNSSCNIIGDYYMQYNYIYLHMYNYT